MKIKNGRQLTDFVARRMKSLGLSRMEVSASIARATGERENTVYQRLRRAEMNGSWSLEFALQVLGALGAEVKVG